MMVKEEDGEDELTVTGESRVAKRQRTSVIGKENDVRVVKVE